MKADPTTTIIEFCRSRGFPLPEKEFYFALPRKFQFDFCFVGCKVALEIEGGIYGRGKQCPLCGRKAVGAHTSIERLLEDMEKYNTAAALGYVVLRFTPGQVSDGVAFGWLERLLKPEE
jgi:hypothetical protein